MEAKKAMRIKSTFWRICRERGGSRMDGLGFEYCYLLCVDRKEPGGESG